ncbi:MAG TPA: hypothetical protein VIS96_06985 [Terrimicrobiaceae bacterium]
MKTASAVLLLIALLMTAEADLLVTWVVETSGENDHCIVKLKEGKCRVDYADWSFLTDSASGRFTGVDHRSKTYLQVSGSHAQTLLETLLGHLTGSPGSKVTAFKSTGVTQEINGYEAKEVAGSSFGIRMSVFIASDSVREDQLEKAMQGLTSGPAFDTLRPLVVGLDNMPGLPIRIVIEAPWLTFTATLESLKETSLDDLDFAIPPDYSLSSRL